MTNEIVIGYEPESLLPKNKKSINFNPSTTETFYIPRRTRFNLDFGFGRKRGSSGRPAVRLVKKRKFIFDRL